MSSAHWFELFDTIYPVMRRSKWAPCPAGVDCAPQPWACCTVQAQSSSDVLTLPYEWEWQAKHLAEDDALPRGCEKCARRKTLLCTLFPLMPFVTTQNHCMISLHLGCEAFLNAPNHYLGMLELAEQLHYVLTSQLPQLIPEWSLTTQALTYGETEPVITLGVDAARRLLSSPDCAQLVGAVMGQQRPLHKPLNERARRLVVLR